jgi:nitric oxide reductase NorQ protein
VVDFVRLCRQKGPDPHYPTLRASIAIARVLAARGGEASLRNPVFQWACKDILGRASQSGAKEAELSSTAIDDLLRRFEFGELEEKARTQPDLRFEKSVVSPI